MSKREEILGEDVVFVGVSLLAWFLGPVLWVVQGNPGLFEVNLHAHSLAFNEYGLQFVVAIGVFNVLYLSSSYLWAMCCKLFRGA